MALTVEEIRADVLARNVAGGSVDLALVVAAVREQTARYARYAR